MVLGKKVAIYDWEWGQNSGPRDGQKRPWNWFRLKKTGKSQFKDCILQILLNQNS